MRVSAASCNWLMPRISGARVRAADDVPRDRLVGSVVHRRPSRRAAFHVAEVDLTLLTHRRTLGEGVATADLLDHRSGLDQSRRFTGQHQASQHHQQQATHGRETIPRRGR